MADNLQKCTRTKKNGEPCPNLARDGRAVCWVHDPDLAAQRAAGRKRGGIVRSARSAVLSSSTPDAPLATVGDLVRVLGDSINQVRKGEIGVNVANAIGVLAGVLLRALAGDEIERRLSLVEASQAARKKRGRT
jgi:hypothetical protein